MTAFACSAPTTPVWPGEISARALGVALASWDDDGNEIRGAVGELVLTKPIPSMPIYFWNDPARIRYEDSYFSVYPGVWRHGDWVTVTEDGSVVMHGRSDSTLNRHGVRLGSAEIYQAVAHLPEIEESLIVGVDEERGVLDAAVRGADTGPHEAASIRRCWSNWNTLCDFLYTGELITATLCR